MRGVGASDLGSSGIFMRVVRFIVDGFECIGDLMISGLYYPYLNINMYVYNLNVLIKWDFWYK